MLDTVHFDKYNERFANDGLHEGLDWAGQTEDVERFKDEYIFSDIMETEIAEKSMMSWLAECLPLHTWEPRHFESEDKEKSPLRNAFMKATKYANKEDSIGDNNDSDLKDKSDKVESADS